MMVKFEVGKVYTTRSICDSDCIFKFRVVGRSSKMLTIAEIHNGQQAQRTRRCKVHEYEGEEIAWPDGHYSMAPIIRATRMAA